MKNPIQTLTLAVMASLACPAFAECPTANLEKAQSYKAAIGDAMVMSEGDAPWKVFCSETPVPDLSIKSIASALQSGDTPIELYLTGATLEFLDGYILDNPYESVSEANQYVQLKALLLGDFVDIFSVKVGEADSGEMKFYIFGRTVDGYLVGLQTILIET